MTDSEITALLATALDEVAPGRSDRLRTEGLGLTLRELEIDSVAAMEIVGVLEEELDLTIPEDELVDVRALSDLAAIVRRVAG